MIFSTNAGVALPERIEDKSLCDISRAFFIFSRAVFKMGSIIVVIVYVPARQRVNLPAGRQARDIIMIMRSIEQRPIPADFRAFLSQEYGIIFFPKRKLDIPVVEEANLVGKVAKRREHTTMTYVGYLNEFIKAEAIGDSFGSRDEKRHNLTDMLEKKFGKQGKDFSTLYHKANQFRFNELYSLCITLNNIAERLVKPTDRQVCERKAQKLETLIDNYQDIESIQKKLTIVHKFEDACIEVLRMLQ